MKPETPKMKIDWMKRIRNENMDEDSKPINQEQEKVIKKLENVLNFLRKNQVKNGECFSFSKISSNRAFFRHPSHGDQGSYLQLLLRLESLRSKLGVPRVEGDIQEIQNEGSERGLVW